MVLDHAALSELENYHVNELEMPGLGNLLKVQYAIVSLLLIRKLM